MSRKIPATVITGFLGSGKTTLVRHLLANAGGRRIALVINEFGDLGVDGEILRGCGDAACREDDIMELSNGCICCTVAEDFIPTMERLLDRPEPPDHIVIETSGLALPQPLIRAFNWPAIVTRVTVDGVISVIDAEAVAAGRFAHDTDAIEAQRRADENLDHERPLAELFEDQLASADIAVVNKTDLLPDDAARTLVEDIRAKVRPGVRVIPAAHGALPVEVILGIGAAAEDDLAARHEVHHHHHHDHPEDGGDHHHDHGHDEFESFVVTGPEVADAPAFARRVAEVIRAHDILRVKGFAAVEGKPMRLALQAVGPRVETYFDRPLGPTEPRETRLVVIGETELDRDAIEAALGNCTVGA